MNKVYPMDGNGLYKLVEQYERNLVMEVERCNHPLLIERAVRNIKAYDNDACLACETLWQFGVISIAVLCDIEFDLHDLRETYICDVKRKFE